ncbi:hypothetical protein Ct9H90mP29_07230 [bacterium]|nr:MAG: hypothetical protein Ct9H90mP29_07230 [bacterium]
MQQWSWGGQSNAGGFGGFRVIADRKFQPNIERR